MEDSQQIKIEAPHDPALPLLGIEPKERKSLSQRDICTPMLTALLFTIVRICKLKCLSMDKWIKKI